MDRTSHWIWIVIASLIIGSTITEIQTRKRPAWAEAKVQAPSTAERLRIEPYRFEPRSGDAVDAELGTFRVPENRGNPESRFIELSFVRFPATTSDPGPPIVYLAGGPGGSGIDTARGRRFPLFMALRQVGDVIAFDQRGTGMSNSIPFCKAPEVWHTEKPATRETVLPWLASTAEHCAAFWRQQGVDLDGYNTNESADDLEALRRELGAESLRLWSISYGHPPGLRHGATPR